MDKTRRAGLAFVVTTLLAGTPAIFAEDVGGVAIRGFVSQGYLNTSANRFLSADTEEGTFAFNEAALNFTAQPIPRVRVAAQLFTRDLGAQGNNRVVLDWGLGEYRAWDTLGFRVGRVKFPVGLYNTLADADVTRPEIFQPSGLYPPERRDLTNAIDGGGVFGTVNLPGAGYLEYEALFGTLDLDETYLLTRVTRETSAALIAPLSGLGLTGLDYVVAERVGKAKRAWGGYVEWHPPVAGLRVRSGLQGADVDFAAFTSYTGFAGPAPVALGMRSSLHSDVPYQLVLSAEYSRGGLRLSAEHSRGRVKSTTTLTGLPVALPTQVTTVHPTSTYGQIAYRFNERVQASGYYSFSYPDGEDKDGVALVQRGQAAHGAWLKDLAFTLRLDVNPHCLVKAEVHRFDGSANLSAAENPSPLEQNWTLFAVKSTLHF